MKKFFTIVSLAVLTIGLLGSCKKDNGPETPKLPEGALSGEFSVSADKKVHFSKGNLYWNGSAFNFEANQYDSPTSWNTSHVSHFFWSKDASVAYAETYSDAGHAIDDIFFTNATAETAKADFTVNGVIGQYRILSTDEWAYLFKTRTMANSGARYENLTASGITVESVTFKGIVLFPDNFIEQAGWKTKYTTWEALNNAGIVFLPTAGFRNDSSISYIDNGFYWSSYSLALDFACRLCFTDKVVAHDHCVRNNGNSVRLVIDIEEE